MPLRVLVTNDDGIAAPGLRVLAETLAGAGHEVIVVAPAQDCSGQAAALGPLHLSGRVEFERVRLGEREAFAVAGPPALCVMAACLSGFGPRADVVVSGINAGANTGRAVLHSGTVGAALTGLNFGLPGLAVSQVAGTAYEWSTAATLAAVFVDALGSLRHPAVVNLNVPNRPLAALGGLVVAQLDPGGTVQAAMVDREAGVLELSIPERPAARAGTDSALVEAGYATVTALAGPHAVEVGMAQLCLQVERGLEDRVRRPA